MRVEDIVRDVIECGKRHAYLTFKVSNAKFVKSVYELLSAYYSFLYLNSRYALCIPPHIRHTLKMDFEGFSVCFSYCKTSLHDKWDTVRFLTYRSHHPLNVLSFVRNAAWGLFSPAEIKFRISDKSVESFKTRVHKSIYEIAKTIVKNYGDDIERRVRLMDRVNDLSVKMANAFSLVYKLLPFYCTKDAYRCLRSYMDGTGGAPAVELGEYGFCLRICDYKIYLGDLCVVRTFGIYYLLNVIAEIRLYYLSNVHGLNSNLHYSEMLYEKLKEIVRIVYKKRRDPRRSRYMTDLYNQVSSLIFLGVVNRADSFVLSLSDLCWKLQQGMMYRKVVPVGDRFAIEYVNPNGIIITDRKDHYEWYSNFNYGLLFYDKDRFVDLLRSLNLSGLLTSRS